MVPVAEFPSRWEAQIALARLGQAGIPAAMVGDPADQVAPHHVTERMVIVVVGADVVAAARHILAVDGADEWTERMDGVFHERRFSDRPPWVRYATWALILAIPGPFAVVILYFVLRVTTGLFP